MDNSRHIRVVLIETHPKGQKGSMARYADMLFDSLQYIGNNKDISVDRLNLAMPDDILKRIPLIFRTWIHHLAIWANAAIRLPNIQADLFHITDGSYAYFYKFLKPKNTVVTVHDIIPYLQLRGRFGKNSIKSPSQWLIRKSIKGLQRANHIFTVSNNTASDLSNYADINLKKISTICNSISNDIVQHYNFNPTPPWPERRYSQKPYILHVGNDAFYKNRAGVLRIFSIIRSRCDVYLKIVGPLPIENEKSLINKLEIGRYLEFKTNIDDNKLFNCYQQACLLLYPSKYEGFGWPPLEAMALGCPVVCSNTASLPEVVGDAALTCNPENEDEMATICLSVLSNASLAAELINKGYNRAEDFSFKKMAQQTLEGYMSVLR